jgi:hypothetical protein
MSGEGVTERVAGGWLNDSHPQERRFDGLGLGLI